MPLMHIFNRQLTTVKSFCLLLLLSFSWSVLQAQSMPLSQFSGFQSGTYIQLSFTISGGNTCQGIEIQRSADSIHFITIGSIAGICGSIEKDESYFFDDILPIANQLNYYRLLLGQLGYSTTIAVPYYQFDDGILLFPNPTLDQATLYYRNEKNELFDISIFDASGRPHMQFTTRDTSVPIETKSLPAGIYFVTVQQSGTIRYFKKLLVL